MTLPYLEMLKNPPHGYGKNFNPCIDCKIFLLQEAKKIMLESGATFLVTGEVIGQRPMSQRRDTLRVIERESGCGDILVRPLCAKNLAPTQAEQAGLIDRDRLLGFSGRSRKPQIQLAARFNITEYPSPAGGCVLTDPILSQRIKKYYASHAQIHPGDILLMTVGRQFNLPTGGWLVVGRNESENNKIAGLAQPDDWLIEPRDIPGPTALLRNGTSREEVNTSAAVVVRYSKKSALTNGSADIVAIRNGSTVEITAGPHENPSFWQV